MLAWVRRSGLVRWSATGNSSYEFLATARCWLRPATRCCSHKARSALWPCAEMTGDPRQHDSRGASATVDCRLHSPLGLLPTTGCGPSRHGAPRLRRSRGLASHGRQRTHGHRTEPPTVATESVRDHRSLGVRRQRPRAGVNQRRLVKALLGAQAQRWARGEVVGPRLAFDIQLSKSGGRLVRPPGSCPPPGGAR